MRCLQTICASMPNSTIDDSSETKICSSDHSPWKDTAQVPGRYQILSQLEITDLQLILGRLLCERPELGQQLNVSPDALHVHGYREPAAGSIGGSRMNHYRTTTARELYSACRCGFGQALNMLTHCNKAHLSLGECRLSPGTPKPNIVKSMFRCCWTSAAPGIVPAQSSLRIRYICSRVCPTVTATTKKTMVVRMQQKHPAMPQQHLHFGRNMASYP